MIKKVEHTKNNQKLLITGKGKKNTKDGNYDYFFDMSASDENKHDIFILSVSSPLNFMIYY